MRFFTEDEFKCSCGCGLGFEQMNDTFLSRLVFARGWSDVPYVINSAIRCEKCNKAVGGSATSSHLKGLAVDIACPSSNARFKIIHGLQIMKFTRFGIGFDFIHVDLDGDKPEKRMWIKEYLKRR